MKTPKLPLGCSCGHCWRSVAFRGGQGWTVGIYLAWNLLFFWIVFSASYLIPNSSSAGVGSVLVSKGKRKFWGNFASKWNLQIRARPNLFCEYWTQWGQVTYFVLKLEDLPSTITLLCFKQFNVQSVNKFRFVILSIAASDRSVNEWPQIVFVNLRSWFLEFLGK